MDEDTLLVFFAFTLLMLFVAYIYHSVTREPKQAHKG